MSAPWPNAFAAVKARYDETGAASRAALYVHAAALKNPNTQKFAAPPYALMGDAGITEEYVFGYAAVVTQKLTITVYALSQEDAANIAALARWNGQPPRDAAGLDFSAPAVAGHRTLSCVCTGSRMGQEAARNENAALVYTCAFDVVVMLQRPG